MRDFIGYVLMTALVLSGLTAFIVFIGASATQENFIWLGASLLVCGISRIGLFILEDW